MVHHIDRMHCAMAIEVSLFLVSWKILLLFCTIVYQRLCNIWSEVLTEPIGVDSVYGVLENYMIVLYTYVYGRFCNALNYDS